VDLGYAAQEMRALGHADLAALAQTMAGRLKQ